LGLKACEFRLPNGTIRKSVYECYEVLLKALTFLPAVSPDTICELFARRLTDKVSGSQRRLPLAAHASNEDHSFLGAFELSEFRFSANEKVDVRWIMAIRTFETNTRRVIGSELSWWRGYTLY